MEKNPVYYRPVYYRLDIWLGDDKIVFQSIFAEMQEISDFEDS